MIQIKFRQNTSNNWVQYGAVYLIGFAFCDGIMLENERFAAYFSDVKNKTDFIQKLAQLSGHFAVCIETDDHFLLAVDWIRSFPVFIHKDNQTIIISNYVEHNGVINENATHDFLNVYCILGNQTLLKQTLQLQAGEIAIISPPTPQRGAVVAIDTYFNHFSDKNTKFSAEKLQALEAKIIRQTKEKAKGKQILFFLSGGYDSRYLLALFRKYDIDNVVCITYGKINSYEVNYAKKTAAALNYPIVFIEYTDALLSNFLKEKWNKYAVQNFNFSSLPHEQDFFALLYLEEKNQLHKNTLVVNGFCQDMLAGSIFEPIQNIDINKFIQKKYLVATNFNEKNTWNDYQNWFVKNRVSKFIVNSTYVYDFFGCDFYLPFWDKDWIMFWYDLEWEERRNQIKYNDYIFNTYFKKYEIDFKKPDYDATNSNYFFRKIVHQLLPQNIIQFFKNKLKTPRDDNNTFFLYNLIYNELKNKPTQKDYKINNIHAKYVIEKYVKNHSPL
jgi:asparagine synthase (glutamine-hydrolysing)